MIKRDYYLNKLIESKENGFTKIITGNTQRKNVSRIYSFKI